MYRAALERPREQRAAFVASLTGDDAELRRSVELMLSREDATDVGASAAGSAGDAASLAPGTLLDHYRIEGLLGRGGSGTVYRGIDTKLNRPVAIKFLSAAVADADARRRFRQEAETASALNHPHIVTVYDVGEHDGRQYIVSELVDGGTLEDWAAAAKRSWRQCTELIAGVADALAAAHAAGVLHRDVKPGNILIDANGYAKLADFGLVKLVGGGAERGARDASKHTRQGVVVGTVAYMSPEQAAGQPLDARSDVFSFGIVLYELLAGRRPFAAANDLELLKAIAHATPAPLPDGVPELLRNAVDKALEKEPADRYQTMQDLVADLRRATRKTGAQPALASAGFRRGTRVAWLATGAALGIVVAALAALAAFSALRAPRAATAAKRMHFTIAVPGYQLDGLAISPDGTRVTYASTAGGTRQIWLRPLDSLEAQVLPGADNAASVVWSPDGRYLGFAADNKLKKLDVSGGPAQTIADLPNMRESAWSRDGTILYHAGINVFNVATASGDKRTWPPQARPDDLPRVLPRFLPDGDHVLYVSPALPLGSSGRTLFVGSLATGKWSRLVDLPVGDEAVPPENTVTTIAYADGYVLYLLVGNGGTLMALPFDAAALAVRGAPLPVARHVAEFSVSATGVLVYYELEAAAAQSDAAPPVARRLVWVDRRGERVGQVQAPSSYRFPALSPDGRRILLGAPAQNGADDIWSIDAERGTALRLTFDEASDDSPIWSPDGSRIAFNSARKSPRSRYPGALYARAASGAGADELLFGAEGDAALAPDEIVVPTDWSRDGRSLIFARMSFATWRDRADLWTLDLNGAHAARPLVQSPSRKASARLSPNGRWFAYSTNETKADEIVVQPFPNADRGKWQLSVGGGTNPRWRADGRELFYLAPNGDVMAVDVDTAGDVFTSGAPHVLFATGLSQAAADTLPSNEFDATADGEKFLLNEPVPGPPRPTAQHESHDLPLHVVLNWSAGLQ